MARPAWRRIFATPVGPLVALADDQGRLLSLSNRPSEAGRLDRVPFAALATWLDGYFAGRPAPLDFPLAEAATPFGRAVRAELLRIPFGHTATYAEIARRLGDAALSRAVGQACAANPVAIVVPCHRVIGARGKLVGYAGGLEMKRALLRHEGVLMF